MFTWYSGQIAYAHPSRTKIFYSWYKLLFCYRLAPWKKWRNAEFLYTVLYGADFHLRLPFSNFRQIFFLHSLSKSLKEMFNFLEVRFWRYSFEIIFVLLLVFSAVFSCRFSYSAHSWKIRFFYITVFASQNTIRLFLPAGKKIFPHNSDKILPWIQMV